jgi:hypothetical protein
MTIKQPIIGVVLSAATLVLLSARADQPVNLNVDMGLWEITTHAQISGGLPPQLQQRLQNMSPAQRQQFEAAMQGAMADAQRGHVFRECMTRKKWSQGFDSGRDSGQCQSTVVSNTRTEFEYRKVCAPQDGPGHTEEAHFHLLDRHHVSGTVDIAQSSGGGPSSIHETVEGKWLSASCGGVKDIERIK